MNRTLLFAATISFFISSCSKEVPPMSKEEVGKKIDSAVKASVQRSDDAARIDLERRLKIEVKVKVDSLVNAHLHKADPPASITQQ